MISDRRQNERAAAQFEAEVLYRGSRRMKMPVLDISLGGCMVDSRAWSAKPGDELSIRLPTLGFQRASVVWIEDQRAGIAFDELLYEPTLEHLSALAPVTA